jgi:signal transduction histidine kinase/ActR/RegA family two-component response regulator
MKPFRDQPIARKALILGVVPTFCAILLVSVASVTATYFTARSNTVRDLDAQAELLADSVSAALAFDDPGSVTETLRTLGARPNIDALCVFDSNQALFASHTVPGEPCDATVGANAPRDRSIVVTRPVTANGRRLGSVVITGNLSLLYAWTRIQAFVIAGALVGGTLIALFLTRLLQRVISGPVLALAATADRVTTSRDYSLRATKTTDDEVGGLVQSFNGMLDEIQRRDETLTVEIAERKRAEYLKDQFLGTVSHELRTPLNAIMGWLQIIRTTKPTGQRLARALENLERNARSQARLIEDLLDVSRMAIGHLRVSLDVVDLRAVLTSAIDTVKPTAMAKSLRLEVQFPASSCFVSADPDRLQQVAWNLLSNAVKFTPAGGTITVTLSATTDEYVFSVQDTGIGLTQDFLPFVFERFRQADGSMTRRHGGLGLGLALVKEITMLHNGSVHAVSRGKDQGSTFSVRLPRLAVTAPQPGANAASDTPRGTLCAGMRILAVDDDPDSLEILMTTLTAAGADVRVAASGDDAIREWTRSPGDVLVCDLAMPAMDGFQVLHHIRSLDTASGRSTAAVALTAYASDQFRDRCLSAGFHGHVGKPCDSGELLRAVTAARALVKSQKAAPDAPSTGAAPL